MAKLTGKQREKLKPSQFVFPDQRAFPINDPAHARSALSRCHQANPSRLGMSTEEQVCRKVQEAVAKKYPEMNVTRTRRK